jgi:hypothetical protein
LVFLHQLQPSNGILTILIRPGMSSNRKVAQPSRANHMNRFPKPGNSLGWKRWLGVATILSNQEVNHLNWSIGGEHHKPCDNLDWNKCSLPESKIAFMHLQNSQQRINWGVMIPSYKTTKCHQLAWVSVVASAITKGTFTNRAKVLASNVFPVLEIAFEKNK